MSMPIIKQDPRRLSSVCRYRNRVFVSAAGATPSEGLWIRGTHLVPFPTIKRIRRTVSSNRDCEFCVQWYKV